jgi:arylsulfatase A-like enzyme
MKINICFIGLGCLFLTHQFTVKEKRPQKPNIIFILADDLGYGDVSCLNENGKIKTPNIDRIGKSGVIFTDAHSSSAVSTPTRYGILTGRYNWRSTLKASVLEGYSPALIPPERTTMASMLRKMGYHTGCIGKWHLGWEWNNIEKGIDSIDYSKPIKRGPTTLGFDYFFGISASLDMPPYVYVENDRVTSVPDHTTAGNNILYGQPGYDGSMWREGQTGSDFEHSKCLPEMTSHAIRFIEENAPSESPYFLYLALPAPHTPILPAREFQGKSGLNQYADFVMMVDSEAGKVLDAVDRSGEKNNTIIVFTSDNGCAPWADFENLLAKAHNPSYIYRGMKSDLFDGGHRIPCFVQWPARIKKPHKVYQTVCLTDFMRTFAEITGYKLADNEAEDSYNILPVILNPEYERIIREATVSHSINGSFTIRQGDWKLLVAAGSGGWSYPKPGKEEAGLPTVQLYNLKTDPAEKINLQAQNPEIVNKMTALLKKYIEDGRSTPGKPQKNDGKYPWEQIMNIIKLP